MPTHSLTYSPTHRTVTIMKTIDLLVGQCKANGGGRAVRRDVKTAVALHLGEGGY